MPQDLIDGGSVACPKSMFTQGLYSLSGKTPYRQISWIIEAARLDVAIVISLWNLTGTSAAALARYQPNFRATGKVSTRISRLRDFTRSCGKTSYRLVNRGPELCRHMTSLGHNELISTMFLQTFCTDKSNKWIHSGGTWSINVQKYLSK